MYTLHKEIFDSQIFRKEVYKLTLNNNLNEKYFSKFLKKDNINILYIFSKFSLQNINLFNKYSIPLISIRGKYKLFNINKKVSVKLPKQFTIIKRSNNKNLSFLETDIQALAKLIGNTSRYYKDKKITKYKCVNLYTSWINNIIKNNYANEAFFLKHNNKLIGLISLRKIKSDGYIDILGINDNYQNQGLGTMLLQLGINYLIDQYVKNIYLISEIENMEKNVFYQKRGFYLNTIQLVYHKHFDL